MPRVIYLQGKKQSKKDRINGASLIATNLARDKIVTEIEKRIPRISIVHLTIETRVSQYSRYRVRATTQIDYAIRDIGQPFNSWSAARYFFRRSPIHLGAPRDLDPFPDQQENYYTVVYAKFSSIYLELLCISRIIAS